MAEMWKGLRALTQEKEIVTLDIVGDSVTQGTDHCTPEETYTAQLAQMIAAALPEISVYRYDGIVGDPMRAMARFDGPICVQQGSGKHRLDVIRNGIGGNTVRRAIRRMNDFIGMLANGQTADITAFQFGINDALRSDPSKYVTPEQFGEDYRELIHRVRTTCETQILIVSATTNDQPIEAHVAETARVAAEVDARYLDLHAIWNSHFDPSAPNFGHGNWLSDTPGDACHPTPIGASVIAAAYLGALL